METEKRRCFIALDLPQKTKEEIVKIQEYLEGERLFKGKFPKREHIHLTLKFLGEIGEEEIEKTRERLRTIEHDRFDAKIGNVGVFDKNHIRIIWLELATEEVITLQQKVDDALEGIFRRERRFMGHITIARVKAVADKDALLDMIATIDPSIEAAISSFSLVESKLAPQGPIYTIIEQFPLKKYTRQVY